MRWRLSAVTIGIVVGGSVAAFSPLASAAPCTDGAVVKDDYVGVSIECRTVDVSPGESQNTGQPAVGDGTTYSLSPVCLAGDSVPGNDVRGCGGYVPCGTDGRLYNVLATAADGTVTNAGQRCVEPGEDDAPTPAVTSEMVAAALGQVPLPESTLVVAPPGGRTLVNFDTIFSTDAEPFPAQLTLLEQQVELELRPASFAWRFGDGAEQTTSTPGTPYDENADPNSYLTHHYREAGKVEARVATTWAARFRVNGGPWSEVNGTVTREGEPVALDVVTAAPQLVG